MITLRAHVIFCITSKGNAFQYFIQRVCFTIHFFGKYFLQTFSFNFFHNHFAFVDLRVSRIENNRNILTFQLQTYCDRVLIR